MPQYPSASCTSSPQVPHGQTHASVSRRRNICVCATCESMDPNAIGPFRLDICQPCLPTACSVSMAIDHRIVLLGLHLPLTCITPPPTPTHASVQGYHKLLCRHARTARYKTHDCRKTRQCLARCHMLHSVFAAFVLPFPRFIQVLEIYDLGNRLQDLYPQWTLSDLQLQVCLVRLTRKPVAVETPVSSDRALSPAKLPNKPIYSLRRLVV